MLYTLDMRNDMTIDEAAQAQEDHDSMVESIVDRKIYDEITQKHKAITAAVRPPIEPKQPTVTDFTEIVASVTQDGYYAVRVLLDSGQHTVVSPWVYREEAERLELAINQVMIEYRTKRNAWEASFHDSQRNPSDSRRHQHGTRLE